MVSRGTIRCAVNNSGSANTVSQAAASSIAARTLRPSCTGMPSSPRLGPDPDMNPTYTNNSSSTLPRYPAPQPNPEIRPDVSGVES